MIAFKVAKYWYVGEENWGFSKWISTVGVQEKGQSIAVMNGEFYFTLLLENLYVVQCIICLHGKDLFAPNLFT